MSRLLLSTLVLAAAACGGDDGVEPPFPADYASTFTEVRDCRGPSGDHDLHSIRVLTSATGADPYLTRSAPFPEGAVVLKPEHDFGDEACADAPIRWTAMVKLAAGSSPETLDWRWFDVDADRTVVSENEPRCIGCHTGCGIAPEGHDGTCAIGP